ncbi:centromere protein S-like isoform 1-T1 [Rhynchonycteris naso]
MAALEEEVEDQERFSYEQRLKAAVHYTVGCLCEEVALDQGVQFSRQTIAAISEVTFRQCENFAKDLEMFARHAKRSTINTEDVKLLARRSNSLVCRQKNQLQVELNSLPPSLQRRDPRPQNTDSREAENDEQPQSWRGVPVHPQDAAAPAAAAAAAALRGQRGPSPGA